MGKASNIFSSSFLRTVMSIEKNKHHARDMCAGHLMYVAYNPSSTEFPPKKVFLAFSNSIFPFCFHKEELGMKCQRSERKGKAKKAR